MLVPQATKGDDSVTWIGQRSCRLFLVHLRRRRNMGELDRRSGIGFMRLAAVQRNAENQQQRSLQENWDQES